MLTLDDFYEMQNHILSSPNTSNSLKAAARAMLKARDEIEAGKMTPHRAAELAREAVPD